MNHAIQLDLTNVGVGPVLVEGPLVDYVESVINNALADPQLGVAVDVATDTGSITLGMGQ